MIQVSAIVDIPRGLITDVIVPPLEQDAIWNLVSLVVDWMDRLLDDNSNLRMVQRKYCVYDI